MFKSKFLKAQRLSFVLLAFCLILSTLNLSGRSDVNQKKIWVGTWSTAVQLVETNNNPPSPGLTNNSLRQIVRVSIGGDSLQLKFSNEYSASPVSIKSVQIAVSTGGSNIDLSTNKELRFNNKPDVTMNPGSTITSDPIHFHLTPRMDVAITIYFDSTSTTITGHLGSRTTSYLQVGNNTSKTDFTGSVPTDHWYIINGIDVLAPSTSACIAILGNSITDGRGSTTNMQNRWPDILSERLLANPGTENLGVLNLGIGGNCVLKGGLGPTGISRYKGDILNQHGVQWVIIFEGINDIGTVKSEEAAILVAENLIHAYQWMIDSAHVKNIKVYGATMMPFKGNSYYNQYSEACRNKINEWIRTGSHYDAIIDFDQIMRNPQDAISLVSSFQHDGLHPDVAGHKKMGDSVDLKLFKGLQPLKK